MQHTETINSRCDGKWKITVCCSSEHMEIYISPVFLIVLFIPQGYNVVVRIPAGATSIDIRQVSYSGTPEDDNYLGRSYHFIHQCNCKFIFKGITYLIYYLPLTNHNFNISITTLIIHSAAKFLILILLLKHGFAFSTEEFINALLYL